MFPLQGTVRKGPGRNRDSRRDLTVFNTRTPSPFSYLESPQSPAFFPLPPPSQHRGTLAHDETLWGHPTILAGSRAGPTESIKALSGGCAFEKDRSMAAQSLARAPGRPNGLDNGLDTHPYRAATLIPRERFGRSRITARILHRSPV